MTKKRKTPDALSADGRRIISGPMVKHGEDWYLQRSVQDYFIKFCESKISPQDVEDRLAEQDGFIKTLRLEVEYKKGNMDQCEGEEAKPGDREGEYLIVYKIF